MAKTTIELTPADLQQMIRQKLGLAMNAKIAFVVGRSCDSPSALGELIRIDVIADLPLPVPAPREIYRDPRD